MWSHLVDRCSPTRAGTVFTNSSNNLLRRDVLIGLTTEEKRRGLCGEPLEEADDGSILMMS